MLNSNMSSTCSQNMVNFGPLTAETCWRVWSTPANFNRFRVLASIVTAPTSLNGGQQHFAGCLAVSWTGALYIRFWGLLSPKAPFTRYNLLSNRLSNRFDNRVNVCIHDTTGCQTRCQTSCTTRFHNRLNEHSVRSTRLNPVYTIQPVVKPVVQPD